eukprot:6670242-Alexandrium_andersonii.AAC.1
MSAAHTHSRPNTSRKDKGIWDWDSSAVAGDAEVNSVYFRLRLTGIPKSLGEKSSGRCEMRACPLGFLCWAAVHASPELVPKMPSMTWCGKPGTFSCTTASTP